MKKLVFLLALLWVGNVSYGGITTTVTMSGTAIVGSPFTSFTAAITAVNSLTITGPVEVLLTAGQIDTSTGKIILNATGTNSNPIIIRKDGIGANPKIVSYVGTVSTASITGDGFLVIAGGDYITIDSIDFTERSTNTTATAAMEYGIALVTPSATNGCQNVTIKNCNITLNRVVSGQHAWHAGGYGQISGNVGIIALHTNTSNNLFITPSSVLGTHRNINITNNVISECNTGIFFWGYETSSLNLSDSGTVIYGNTVTNFGGASIYAVSAICMVGQYYLTCSNNMINNNTGTGTYSIGSLRGIDLYSSHVFTKCEHNIINLQMGNANGAYTLTGISYNETAPISVSGNTLRCIGNTLSLNYATATNGNINGLMVFTGNGATTAYVDSNIFMPIMFGTTTSPATNGGVYVLFVSSLGSTPTSTYVRNNHIQRITRIDTNGYQTFPIRIANSGNKYFSNNVIENISVSGTGSADQLTVVTLGGTTPVLICDSNQIRKVSISKTTSNGSITGIFIGGSITNSENIRKNTLDSIITTGTGSSYGISRGLSTTSGASRSIIGNKISNITSSNEIIGIFSNCDIGLISGNFVKNLTNTSSTGYTVGIKLFPGAAFGSTVVNNIVSGLYPHSASTRVPSAVGMDIGAMPVDIFHNTVILDSFGNNLSSTGATFGVQGVSLSGNNSYIRRIKNNIISIKSTPRGSTGYSTAIQETGTPNAYTKSVGLEISHNVLHSNNGTWNFYHTRGFRTGFSPLKNGYGTDSVITDNVNNVRADKFFNNSCGLFNRFIGGINYTENNLSSISGGIHTPVGASYAESRGDNTTGITTDYLGNTYGNPPDISAISFTGTSVPVTTPNLSLATITQTSLVPQCIVSNWTYYGKSNDTNLYLAINKSGTTGITGDTVTITIDTNRWSLMSLGANRPTGSFLLKHGWNVTTSSSSFTGIAQVRFPYSVTDTVYTRSLRDTQYNRALTGNPSMISVSSQKLEWFKTVGIPYNASWQAGILGNLFPSSHIKLRPVYGNSGADYVQFDSITSFSGGSGGYSFGPPNGTGSNGLAVKWLSISGLATDTGNLISWSTASEEKSKYFSAEYSFDAITFYPTGDTVTAAGNSVSPRTYSIPHKRFDSLLYYRIVQVGTEGDMDVSSICAVKRSKISELQVQVYPNPFTDYIHIVSNLAGNMTVYSVLGQKVFSAPVSPGNETYDFTHFQKGFYIVEIITENDRKIVKIQKD